MSPFFFHDSLVDCSLGISRGTHSGIPPHGCCVGSCYVLRCLPVERDRDFAQLALPLFWNTVYWRRRTYHLQCGLAPADQSRRDRRRYWRDVRRDNLLVVGG